MNRVIIGLLVVFLFLSLSLKADDLSFDSFQAAERAAQQRAQEYERKMKEHLNNVNQKWEQQQRDIGQSGDNPDISDITTSSQSNRSSDNADADKMDQAVQSSLDKLKNQMINSANPGSTGFAGGSAGYQWRVKKVGDKYVLSDSYSQAAFNTGAKNEGPEASGSNTAAEPQIASRSPGSTPSPITPPASPAAPSSPTRPSPSAGSPRTGSPSSSGPSSPAGSSGPSDSGSEAPGSTPDESAPPSEPSEPSELAPPDLPPPAVRLVIEHPIDFSEEIFTSNANAASAVNYQLQRFSIPEDTRVRLSIELADDINPDDVSMIVVDEEGARPPVTSSKLNNYRHMFRVPSDDKYSASIYINDPTTPGAGQRKIMQVQIPVTPVDFESRTIDGRNTGKSGATSSTSSMSAPGAGSQARSNFGQPQQVDLSDLYARPGTSAAMSASAGGAAAAPGAAATHGATEHAQNATHGTQGQTDQGANAGQASDQRSRQQMAAANRRANQGGTQGQNAGAQRHGQQARSAQQRTRSSSGSAATGSSSGHGNQHAYAPGTSSSGGRTGATGASGASGATTAGSSAHRATHSAGTNSTHSSAQGVNAANSGDSSADSGALTRDEQEAGYYYDSDGVLRDAAGNAVMGDQNTSRVRRDDLADIYNAEDMIDDDDDFLLAISVRAPDQNIYQSFNFISNHNPATRAVPAGTELAFSVVLGKSVDPDSISIRVNNGESEVSGNLNTMGQSFAYSFPRPASSAKLNIKGRSNKGAFNYNIQIPLE